jgi:hypothetical protein
VKYLVVIPQASHLGFPLFLFTLLTSNRSETVHCTGSMTAGTARAMAISWVVKGKGSIDGREKRERVLYREMCVPLLYRDGRELCRWREQLFSPTVPADIPHS